MLLEEGFIVFVSSDDVCIAVNYKGLGVHAICRTNLHSDQDLWYCNPLNLSFIIEQATVPVIVDAGNCSQLMRHLQWK